MIRHAITAMFALVVAASVTGCASPVTVATWQKSVETYVRDRGGGDPSVLRSMTWNNSQRGFSVIEKDRPSESNDVIGLLLANIRAQDQPWVVFLVGRLSKNEVEEIRVAALSVADGQYTWRLGPSNDDALDAYQKYNADLFHRRFPRQRRVPPAYQRFPREEDQFLVATEADAVEITHRQSGARWQASFSPGAQR